MLSTGLGDQLFVAGYDLSGDVGAVDTLSSPMEPLEATPISLSAKKRLAGLRDGMIEFTGFFNPDSGASHDVLSALPTADVVGCYFHGSGVGEPAAGIVAKQITYDFSRGDDGSATWKSSLQGCNYGLNWGEQLTAGKQTLGTAGAGTSHDYGAGVGTTNFGLQAFLHVFAFTGTSATVAIQSSTDNGVGDAFANITGAVFAAATGITSERIATGPTAAVERYVRVNVTGTFSDLVFAVICCRNLAATVF